MERSLLHRIEAFLAESRMPPSVFGRAAAHDPRLVSDLRGGRALALLWTRANQCGLAVHPVSPVFLFARDEQDRAGLSAEFTDELTDLQARFAATVGLPAAEAPVLVVRVSHDVAPAARSRRLSDAAVLLASTPPTEGEQLR